MNVTERESQFARQLEVNQKDALSNGLTGAVESKPVMTQAQYDGVGAGVAEGLAARLNTENAAALVRTLGQIPFKLPTFTVATAPPAAAYVGSLIYVSNGGAGSPVVAFSDGSNWKRVDTLATIS